jgi:non-homologous end joining protein Ku
MARDIWKGSISFGLVEIPVSLVAAEKSLMPLLQKSVQAARAAEKTASETPARRAPARKGGAKPRATRKTATRARRTA